LPEERLGTGKLNDSDWLGDEFSNRDFFVVRIVKIFRRWTRSHHLFLFSKSCHHGMVIAKRSVHRAFIFNSVYTVVSHPFQIGSSGRRGGGPQFATTLIRFRATI